MKCLSWLFVLLFFTGSFLPAQVVSPEHLNTQQKKVAQDQLNVLQAFKNKQYDFITSRLNQKLAKKMDSSRLKKVWQKLSEGTIACGDTIDFGYKTVGEDTFYLMGFSCGKEKYDLEISLEAGSGLWKSLYFRPYTYKKWTPPPYAAVERFTEQPIKIGHDSSLSGRFTLPKGADHFPIVVMVHGSGPNDMDESLGPNKLFKDLAYGLGSEGIGSLRYNKRSYEHADALKADLLNVTIDNVIVDDAIAAIEQARSLTKGKVILLGHSLGGHLSPRIAEFAKPDAVILLAGNATPLEDIILPQLEYIMKYDSTTSLNEFQYNALKYQISNLKEGKFDSTTIGTLPFGLPGKFWQSLLAYDPIAAVSQQTIPYLVLNGSRDYQVPPAEVEKWAAHLKHPYSQTRVFEKLNHMFYAGEGVLIPSEYEKRAHVEEEVMHHIIKWVKKLPE
jgi:fermentation-respiration switch protein FrsA (DUF1100 family)